MPRTTLLGQVSKHYFKDCVFFRQNTFSQISSAAHFMSADPNFYNDGKPRQEKDRQKERKKVETHNEFAWINMTSS